MKLRNGRYKSPPRLIRRPSQVDQQNHSSLQSEKPQANQAATTSQTPDVQADVSLEDALDKLYTDINSVPSFSAKINDFLRQNHVHSVHKRIVKKTFPRRKIIARFPFDIWMGDLIEYPQFKFNNRQYVYILILIDCFTKKVYCSDAR